MEIIKATKEDLKVIDIHLNVVIDKMVKAANPQWTRAYPKIQDFENDLNNNQLYVYKINNEIIGYTALTTNYDEWFYIRPHTNQIISKNSESYFVHRMFILPKHQNNNLSVGMYQAIIEYAKKKNKQAVHVDTHETNIPMNRSILKSGFTQTGKRGRINRSGEWITYEYVIDKNKTEM